MHVREVQGKYPNECSVGIKKNQLYYAPQQIKFYFPSKECPFMWATWDIYKFPFFISEEGACFCVFILAQSFTCDMNAMRRKKNANNKGCALKIPAQ